MSNFESAFAQVIGYEGGYSSDAGDAGGETKFGISKRAYPFVDIKNLTLEGAKAIYWADYWNRMLLAELTDDDIAEELFEQGVNMGPAQAIEHAQRSVCMVDQVIDVDGWIGAQTVNAINGLGQKKKVPFLKCLNGYQFLRYVEIVRGDPTQRKFFVGWLRRIEIERPATVVP